MLEKENISGIIVTYNPNENNLFAIESNCNILHKVIIYDNSTVNENRINLSNLVQAINSKFSDKKREVILIRGEENIGLSKAYNHCASVAKRLGYSAVLILDQDSFFVSGGFDILVSDYNKVSLSMHTGAISPSYMQDRKVFYDFLFDGRFKWRGFYYTDSVIELRTLINSGMLVPLDVFDSVSGYDERIFLDNSDLNFTLRVRLSGYHLFQSKNSRLIHNYGESVLPGSMAHILHRNPDRDIFIKDLIMCLPIARKISSVDLWLILLLVMSKIFSTMFLKDMKKERLNYIMQGIKSSTHFKQRH